MYPETRPNSRWSKGNESKHGPQTTQLETFVEIYGDQRDPSAGWQMNQDPQNTKFVMK